jgi:hypothetical protein
MKNKQNRTVLPLSGMFGIPKTLASFLHCAENVVIYYKFYYLKGAFAYGESVISCLSCIAK